MIKKTLLIFTVIFLLASLSSEIEQERNLRQGLLPEIGNYRIYSSDRRDQDVPSYSFTYEPQFIMTNYYDYFPGGYESIPIRVQSIYGGLYVIFQSSPEAGATRRIYYSYISEGDVTTTSLVDFENTLIEGFPGVDLDNYTGNPFVAWHVPGPVDPNIYAIGFTYDDFSLLSMPGLWNTVYHPVDNINYPHSVLPELDPFDEFIWPKVIVGPSPLGDMMKRVYLLTYNANTNASGMQMSNILVAWTDYEHHTEIATFSPEDWSYTTMPVIDDWGVNDIQSFKASTLNSNGNLIIVGNTYDWNEDTGPYSDDDVFFLIEAVDIDNGQWEIYTQTSIYPVDNPLDPATGQGILGDPPFEHLRYSPYANRHNVITDDQGNVHYVTALTLSSEEGSWWPIFTTVKHLKFNYQNQEFEKYEIYPNLGSPDLHLPWEVDDNGYIIEDVGFYNSYPVYWWGADDFFHENYYRIMADGNRMVILFQDATKAKLFNSMNNDDYASWANVPETYIFVSNDYGNTWRDPIILSANDTPELHGMIPAYWYIADSIDFIDDDWGRIHLFFYSQNDYGSSLHGNSPDTGGNLYYTAMEIDFGFQNTEEQLIEADTMMLSQNYPNPFNPFTSISFTIPYTGRAKLEIFNIKGQLVKTIADREFSSGEHTLTWDGKDNFGNNSVSGVYFYKLSTQNNIETKKMILLK